MSRCKACDAIMKESELKRTDYNTDKPLGLCYNCMNISTSAALAFEGGGVMSEEDNVDLSELGFDISNN